MPTCVPAAGHDATSFLCVRRGTRAVCVERLEGHAVRSLAMQLGSSLPLYAGAGPRALLAFMPPSEQEAMLDSAPRYPGDPPQPAAGGGRGRPEEVRRRGYSISDGDVTPGIAALGAPVFNHRHELVASISISGLRGQVLGRRAAAQQHAVPGGRRDLSRALGDGAPHDRAADGDPREARRLVGLLAERGP